MQRHLPALLCAALIGICIVGPHLFFIAQLGANYRGIYMMKTDAEPYYLARIHEAYRGLVGVNPYIYEEKYTLPPTNITFVEPVLALPGILLHVSAATLALFYKFLFPVLIALLIYFLFYTWTKSRGYSLAALFLVLGAAPMLTAHALLSLTHLKAPGINFAMYSQPVDPQVTSLLLFLYLFVLYTALTRVEKKWYVYTSLLLGCLFYVYFYAATFALALTGVTTLLLIVRKRMDDAKKLALALIGGIGIGGFFFYNLYTLITHPLYLAYASGPMIALAATHHPVISAAWVFTMLVFLCYFFSKKVKTEVDFFFLALLITAVAVINQQILTGHMLQEGHYHWYYNMPIFLMTLLYIAHHHLQTRQVIYSKLLIGLIVGFSLLSITVTQTASYRTWFASVADEQRYAPALTWLSLHSEKDSVVFANASFSELTPVFTFDSVVWDPQAQNYLLPPGRADFTPEHIFANGFLHSIERYRVDYVVWDMKKEPEWHMEQYATKLTPVFEQDGMRIYSLSFL